MVRIEGVGHYIERYYQKYCIVIVVVVVVVLVADNANCSEKKTYLDAKGGQGGSHQLLVSASVFSLNPF